MLSWAECQFISVEREMPEFLEAFEKAMDVHVVDGEVVVLGPDGVAVSLTATAAEESARRLKAGAEEARRSALAGPRRRAED